MPLMELLTTLWSKYLIHVADILLVTYIFYRLLLLIRGTRAVQVLRGVVVLAVATFLVQNVFRLPTLSWLFRTFWLAWAVVLAVVFQPELRSVLAQLGSRRLGRLLFPEQLNFINEIISALREASQNRLGMLIVLEQETGLRNFIETGTLINGEVSRDMLLTIFQPRTILHDGAVIVREDRLVAAGCVLPLSNDPDISRILGTRHRAAIGITEISDAVVLVVSEETGVVSVARNGRLDRDVNLDELRDRLRDFYKSMQERGLIRKSGPRDA
ncbi:MAG TPA: diadenylate cyclase CdaA [Elusimicrobiota bacterium]|nr:diadenylate cyclase CdaA [Elusimicrobiota bacterium]